MQAKAWNWGGNELPSDTNLITHTFTQEGHYEVRTQVIYWDGEVIRNHESRAGAVYVYVDPPGTVPAPGI